MSELTTRRVLLGFFGVIHLVFCIAGLWYFAGMLWWHWAGWHERYEASVWGIFIVLSVICLFFCLSLGYLGMQLLRGRESILKLCVLLYIAELVYSVTDVAVLWIILPVSMASVTIGFLQVAEGPIDPQLVVRFPWWGLVSMGLLWKFPNLFRKGSVQ